MKVSAKKELIKMAQREIKEWIEVKRDSTKQLAKWKKTLKLLQESE